MKLRVFYFFVLTLVLVPFSNNALAQMVDSSEYVSIVEKIQQKEFGNSGTVRINQSSAIKNMLEQNAFENQHNQSMQGYRVRIFRDNSQQARTRSEQIEEKFKEYYPEVGVYRSYTNPYFIVAVGDFRTVDDAVKFLNQLTTEHGKEYSNAWIVKEKIYFPPLNSYERQY